MFMFLIDYAARLLRPVNILRRVARLGRKVIADVYPSMIEGVPVPRKPAGALGPPDRTIPHSGAPGIVIAMNLDGLMAEAKRADCIIEIAPQVGDGVATGEPLFHLRGGNTKRIDDERLRGLVAFGPERTIEQDSTFAFRIIVDIALKALSPAINDPTTAVLAIDQLERLLRDVGQRYLHDERILDVDGRLRLIFRTPNWDDFVELTFTEIIQYGAASPQVARRLRAMIESSMKSLPEVRLPVLREQQAQLDQTIELAYHSPRALALARVPDRQGLGAGERSPTRQLRIVPPDVE
jgi:uncharacterized membrane protein